MSNKQLRIAFLSDEFVTERNNEGGLGTYLNRITQALKDLGHTPEIFVIANNKYHSIIDFNGIRVERIPTGHYSKFLRAISYILDLLNKSQGTNPINNIARPLALAYALEKRHKENPFDFVQSTNCSASGLFVKKLKNRPHLIRLSSHRKLWNQIDSRKSVSGKIVNWLEQISIERADIAYSPSEFLANYFHSQGQKKVKVLRPPVFIENNFSLNISIKVPERYLIHFGRISYRKGSDILARSLCKVWQQDPNLKMVWAGREIEPGSFENWRKLWGHFSSNVIWLGALKKEKLYPIIQGAEAAVLPSRVDNLPNTAIESLMFGIPIIATKNSSIDELIEPGISGDLVDIEDEDKLACLMVEVWRKQVSWIKSNFQQPKIMSNLVPSKAANNLIKLALR
ncbi:MAG: glycosyltransferase family 4 protein [Xenococcaceae cyanobacterium MO_207.B15]|nr:glycosyltransferase family 4 protein [Xenococcaceae cyanobacterium MO_207.B15]